MFHTLLVLHLDFLQDLNSCFGVGLLDPFAFINFNSPFNSYYFINLLFPLTFGIFFLLKSL